MRLPIGPWEPDKTLIRSSGSFVLENVIPITGGGYRPTPSFEVLNDTGIGQVLGSGAFSNQQGSLLAYVGTATDIYLVTSDTVESKGTGYNATPSSKWSMTVVEDKVAATNITDGLQVADLGLIGTFAPVAAAPNATTAWTSNKSLFLGNHGGTLTHKISWSAAGDVNDWTPNPVTGAGEQELPKSFGPVMGGVGGQYSTIFQYRGITRATFIGGDLIYRFETMDETRGLVAKDSLVPIGREAFFYSQEGFCHWDGQSVRPIGNDIVNRWVWENGAAEDLVNLSGSWDQVNQIVRWFWTGPVSIGFHPKSGQWVTFRTKEIQTGETFSPVFTQGKTYNLDVDHPAEDPNLDGSDALPETFDSPFWDSKQPFFGGVINGKFGVFNGVNESAKIETSEFGRVNGRICVNSVFCDLNCDDYTNVRMGLRSRDFIAGDTADFKSTKTANRAGYFPVLGEGKYLKIRLEIFKGKAWSSLSAFELETQDGGRF